MANDLADAIRRYTEAQADQTGVVRTPIPGLHLVRTTCVGALQHAIQRPLICLIAQGAKQVTTVGRSLTFGAGEAMLVTAEVPTVTQVTRASGPSPYLALALYLDLALIADLAAEMQLAPVGSDEAVCRQPTDREVADAALRLVRLLDHPAAIPLLQAQQVRELHYWLLAGRHGGAMRRLGLPDSRDRLIRRTVEVIRGEFASPLRVERLASIAGMSVSTFHGHFRRLTSLSPLQFQKRLRLIEARRLMMGGGVGPGQAAHRVGYESVSQFTREYGRLFGAPPARDISRALRVGSGTRSEGEDPSAWRQTDPASRRRRDRPKVSGFA